MNYLTVGKLRNILKYVPDNLEVKLSSVTDKVDYFNIYANNYCEESEDEE